MPIQNEPRVHETRRMLYQRSLEIERRLNDVLRLIRQGQYSTPRIAEALSVTLPTVSRDVTALRERGHDIRSEKSAEGWHYLLLEPHRRHGRTRDSSTKRKHGALAEMPLPMAG